MCGKEEKRYAATNKVGRGARKKRCSNSQRCVGKRKLETRPFTLVGETGEKRDENFT